MNVLVNNELIRLHEHARVIDAVRKYLAGNKALPLDSVAGVTDHLEHPVGFNGRLHPGDRIQITFK